MSSHVAWNEIRAEHVARAGGEATVEAGKRQLLAEVVGHRLAEVRRTRGPTQQQVADRMGVSKGSHPRSNAARSPDKTSWPATPPRSAAASTCQLLDAGHSELIGGAA